MGPERARRLVLSAAAVAATAGAVAGAAIGAGSDPASQATQTAPRHHTHRAVRGYTADGVPFVRSGPECGAGKSGDAARRQKSDRQPSVKY
jgi:hypothetical protein